MTKELVLLLSVGFLIGVNGCDLECDEATGSSLACSGFPEPVEKGCPPSMIYVDGGVFVLGELELPEFLPAEFEAAIYEGTFEIEPFCVDTFPFPGVEGAPWPTAELSARRALELESRVAPYGRRLCSISELLLASAGPDNWRYPYDPEVWIEDVCDPDDLAPLPLGSYPDCVSPIGARDFQVRSGWGRLDPQMKEHLNAYGSPPTRPDEPEVAPESFNYAVHGGTSRAETFYSPTNFGIHSHPEEATYLDDGIRLCASPAQSWDKEQAYLGWLSPALAGEDVFSELDPN